MATQAFNLFSTNNLSFTNIWVSEVNTGLVLPFVGAVGQPFGIATVNGATIDWAGFSTGVYYANSTEVLNISYTVTSTDGANLIDAMSQNYIHDVAIGSGVSLTGVERAYSQNGILLGTNTISLGAGSSATEFAVAQTSINVQITLTLAIGANGSNISQLLISSIQNNFTTIATSATASIGDIVFNDFLGTGLETGFNAGPGIAGVTVELLNATGTAVLALTTTDATGHYNFTGLTAGVYEVQFVALNGYGFTTQGVGSNPGINSSANQLTGITGPITVTAGEFNHNVEAGLIAAGNAGGSSGSIGNTVWLDTNGNGLLDNNESGLAGVTVDLLDGSGAFLAATATDASGSYQFTNLGAGNYEVQVLAPAGDGFTIQNVANGGTTANSAVNSAGLTAVITLTTGEINNNIDAGLTPPPASIGSTVWLDANNDGLFEANETGAAGVTVELLNAAGKAILATTTTNAGGTYAFTGLKAGVYEVEFITPTGNILTAQGVGTDPSVNSSADVATGLTAPITLTGGQNDTTVNAGLQVVKASLGSTVFLDANRDGLLNNGETGVAGVTVELLNAAGTSVLATTTTNMLGTYAFTNLNPGAYEVEFFAPAGDILTTRGVGTNGAINSSANATTGITDPVTLTAGQNNTNVNAGLQIAPASLGSKVFLDANRNGLLDAGEAGVAGVTVELLNAAGTSILATTTTDSTGAYAFDNLNPGAYEVEFIAPAGNIFTTRGVGTNPALNSSPDPSTGITTAVTLTAGQNNPNVEAGLQIAPASLGSTVWLDTNANGLLDAGETGVAAVTVELLNAAGTAILATTTTGHAGAYAFNGLNAGVYEVQFIAPPGDTFTTQGVGTNAALNSSAAEATGITAPITLTAGQVNNNVEAGLVPVPVTTALIGNTVWLDTNRDGLDNNGETGVAGVTVELLNGAGTAILAITTTNASGTYQFANLAAGTYEVKVLAPAGDTFTTQNATATGTTKNSAVGSTGQTAAITLTAGQVNNNVNAGLVLPPASLGTTVFLDTNRNGLLDAGETGVAGVTVELLNAAGTSILATTTTNASGTYAFTGLNAGTYEVAFIAPTGDILTTRGVGTDPAVNSSANASTGITAPITLTAGQNDTVVNAGLQISPASLGSTVFLDANRNGLLDNGEVGVAGVTVELLNAAGTSILATTTTSSTGAYAFTNLNPGSYEVAFIAPTGDIFTTKDVGTNTAINSSANATTGITAAIALSAGQNNPNVNAGLQIAPASLGSIVFMDANRNGLLDNGEAGVAGVTVDLLNAAGTSVLAVTTTNASGAYAFTGLNPGAYEVKFVAPAGDIFTAQGVGTNPAINSSANASTGITAAVTLTAGQNNPNVNAGLELPPASIGNFVWLDTNKDGLQSTGEFGVAGVTVELLNGTGTSILATTTTGSTGAYNFANLNAGVYEIKVLAPAGDTFTTQGAGTNAAISSSANATTGVTAPITLTTGQINNNVDVGLTNTSGLSVLKLPSTMVVTQNGQVTYTFTVTNTGTTALSNVNIQDNIGTAAIPVYVTPTLVTTGTNGILGAGQTWTYTQTVSRITSTSLIQTSSTQVSTTGTSIAPLTSAQFNALNSGGAVYGPAASAAFTDGPFTVASGVASNLMTAPRASDANGIALVLSATAADIAALGSQTIQLTFNGQTITFSAANFASGSSEGFPSSIGGLANGQVNGIRFSSSLHAGANFTYAAPLSSVGGTGSSLGSVVVTSPINLRVDVFGDKNGVIIDNAANSGAEGVSGAAGAGGSFQSAGVTDTVTVTAQSPTGTTVSASDTKEVEVLAANSNISVGGTATTAGLSATYGAAKTLEFTYTPGNTVSLKQVQSGLGIVTGTNTNSMAFMQISNTANWAQSGASIYFQGAVTSGEKIFADATTNVLTNTPIAGGHFSTSAGTDIFAFVFTSQQAFLAGSAPVQTMAYNVSGSQVMHFGDTIGSLSVAGYIGATGGHLVS